MTSVLQLEHNVHVDMYQSVKPAKDINRLWIAIRGQMSGIVWIIIYDFVIENKIASLEPNCNHMPFHSYLLLGLGIDEFFDNVHQTLSLTMQHLVKPAPLGL